MLYANNCICCKSPVPEIRSASRKDGSVITDLGNMIVDVRYVDMQPPQSNLHLCLSSSLQGAMDILLSFAKTLVSAAYLFNPTNPFQINYLLGIQ